MLMPRIKPRRKNRVENRQGRKFKKITWKKRKREENVEKKKGKNKEGIKKKERKEQHKSFLQVL